MKYKANFRGRKLHASGIFYDIEDTVEAENEESANLKLYEKYDSVMFLKLTPLEPSEQAPTS